MERVSFDVSVKKSGFAAFLLVGVLVLGMGLFVSCGYKPEEMQGTEIQGQGNGGESEEITDSGDSGQTTVEDKETQENLAEIDEKVAPTKDEVLAMRAKALEGMSEQEIERLKENIKVANQRM